jgi:hypothetical protein
MGFLASYDIETYTVIKVDELVALRAEIARLRGLCSELGKELALAWQFDECECDEYGSPCKYCRAQSLIARAELEGDDGKSS